MYEGIEVDIKELDDFLDEYDEKVKSNLIRNLQPAEAKALREATNDDVVVTNITWATRVDTIVNTEDDRFCITWTTPTECVATKLPLDREAAYNILIKHYLDIDEEIIEDYLDHAAIEEFNVSQLKEDFELLLESL